MNREVDNEQEVLDKDQEAVSRLVAGLKHIEAPAYFDRRVMAKIGEGRPGQRGSFPTFAYAVPVLIVLLIATFFAFRLGQPVPVPPTTVAANISSPPPPLADPMIKRDLPAATTPANPLDQSVAKAGNDPLPRTSNRRRGGSVDISEPSGSNNKGSYVTGQNQTQLPRPDGLENTSSSTANRNDVIASTPITVEDILDNLGMSVTFEDGWRVKTLTENGVAQKSGVAVGDVITALDDRSIDSTTTFNGFGTFRSITVKREGKIVPIAIIHR
jgi:hypothetical protein